MTTITIRHVPEDVRDELAARAARGGQSLQEYLLRELIRLASYPTIEEVLDRARARSAAAGRSFTREEIVDLVHADRR